MDEGNQTLEQCEDKGFCAKYNEAPDWMIGIRLFVAILIVTENAIIISAILKNWKTLMRQHNLYRYVFSLVFADLFNGFILFVNSLFWIVLILTAKTNNLQGENFSEVLRNLITGALHGLTFASLTSAALLNLVLRLTSTRALARAAAIKPQNQFCLSRISWVRNPRISVGIIGFMWTVTLTFIIVPLAYHCHSEVCQCFDFENSTVRYLTKTGDKIGMAEDDSALRDCSILRTPSRRSYLVVLNSFITFSWCIMLIFNVLTICIKTEVRRKSVLVDGVNNLTMHHSFGITRDSSSFFAFVITTSLTISTIPFVIFTFITEAGTPYQRIYFGRMISPITVDLIEMTTYFSSAVNPFIYTAMLSRLRSDVSRILGWRKITRVQNTKSRKIRLKSDIRENKHENLP